MGEIQTMCLIRGQFSKYVRNAYHPTAKELITRFKKWTKHLNRHFPKEEIHIANREGKTLTVTNHQRNAKHKAMRYHLIPVRMASAYMTTRVGKEVKK